MFFVFTNEENKFLFVYFACSYHESLRSSGWMFSMHDNRLYVTYRTGMQG